MWPFRKKPTKDDFFVEENAQLVETSYSPSGEYRLEVHTFTTKIGCWEYSRGRVYRLDTLLFEVKRNYRSFPFLWVENHPNGHKYLVCGEDYQGQTVLELDTGKRLNSLSTGSNKGNGFCWVSYEFEPKSALLVVEGCIWACPYEYRFFDFSDPISGWPQLETAEIVDCCPHAPPVFNDDGTITCRESRNDDRSGDNEWSIELGEGEDVLHEETEGKYQERDFLIATKTLKRNGFVLELVSLWTSEAEKKRREESARSWKAYEEWWDKYRSTDPLYLELSKSTESDSFFNPSKHASVGRTYNKWLPEFDKNETMVCRRILDRKKHVIDVEIATETGPVLLTIYYKKRWNQSQKTEKKFFPHSVEGVKDALAYAKKMAK